MKPTNPKHDNYKYYLEVNRLLVKKSHLQSQINNLGNKMFKLKNERLAYMQDRSRVEKTITNLVNKNNNIGFIQDETDRQKNSKTALKET